MSNDIKNEIETKDIKDKEIKSEHVENNVKTLTSEEMLTLELNFCKQVSSTKDITISKREETILTQQIELNRLQIEILKLQLTAKKEKTLTIEKSKDSIKTKTRKFTQSIAQKYELDEGWGFNPDTGEIV